MSNRKLEEKNFKEESDINAVFEDLAFVEDRSTKNGLAEGYKVGCWEGEREGYHSGYEIGFEIGQELALIYGTVVALEQISCPKDTPIVKKLVQKLRQAIEGFPQYNDYHFDIKGNLEDIRFKYKHLCTIIHPSRVLYIGRSSTGEDKKHQNKEKNYSF